MTRMRMSHLLDLLTNMLLNKTRIDHNPMYICVMVWDLFAGSYAVYVGLPDLAMTQMTHYAQNIICWAMFVGGVICVHGIILGTRMDPGYWIRSALGKVNKIDLRIPYFLGMFGTPLVMVSFFFYSIAIAQLPWAHTMISEISLAIAVGCGATANFLRFALEIRSINSVLPKLIVEEIRMRDPSWVASSELE